MAYAPIITKADLDTHLYEEILNEISRDNDDIITEAIATGIEEVKTYLSRYDLVQMFGDETDDTAATFSNPYLRSICKTVVIWHLMKLARINLDYETKRNEYLDVIDALKMIQAGKTDPRWPYLDATDLSTEPGISITIKSNEKRNNGY